MGEGNIQFSEALGIIGGLCETNCRFESMSVFAKQPLAEGCPDGWAV